MHPIDWIIVVALLLVLTAAAARTRRYTRSVSAFLVANRAGGRYLISMATAMAGLGVISIVALFEQNYDVGYTSLWWGAMTEPALIILALSGWVIYRFRQTRAMTLAQFFQARYSRNFRVFAGVVAYLAGIINFGIFPAVGARFFIALCSLPEAIPVAGVELSTFPLVMALLLSISLAFTFMGGHIAVMVTDFIQGVFANTVFIIVMVYLLLSFSWGDVSEALLQAPPDASLVHPFKLGAEERFNVWYYLISVVIIFYGVLAWQGTQGYNCCAKDPHEAKMAGILNGWRYRVLLLIVVVAPVVVRTLLHHPDYAAQAEAVNAAIGEVDSETLRTQLRTPLALAVILPKGLLGLLCAAMLAAFISTHDTYLHSWGSILVQDVVLPFRRKPFTPRQHLLLLRLSILGIAVFIFLFSLLFPLRQYIAMFFALTGAVFFGGAGSAIIGGLYWRRGSAAGAWAAMVSGLTLALLGVAIEQTDASFFEARAGSALWAIPAWIATHLTGQEITFWTILISITLYVVVSLLGPRTDFDMDRLLHRGKHAVAGERATSYAEARTWLERLGVSREFTGRDRIVTLVSVGWPLAWTVVFVAGTAYNLIRDVPDASWLRFWHFWTWFLLASAIAVTAWFSIGGLGDLRYLFKRLRAVRDDPEDDGRVDDDA